MIKFYKNGEEFLKDNIVILNQYPLDTSFFKVNSKLLNTFDRRNYSFKVIDGDNYLLVMKLDDYNLLIFGETNLVKEAIDIICDYHLYFYGILASKELIDEFYLHYINRRGGESFIRHKMDMMYLKKLKENPTMSVVKADPNDINIIANYVVEFNEQALNESNINFKDVILRVTKEIDSYYLLKINNKIVSMAKIAREDDNICAITSVYTPIEHRNKGYSRQVVTHICQLILNKGKTPYLYVDKENPISNHLYLKIGFQYAESKYDVAYKKGDIATLILAGGCFWCIAEPFYHIDGVKKVISGYTGGSELFPTYELVKDHKTGHREAILIEYDKTKLATSRLIDVYYDHIDPFDDSGQFIDKGFNYTCALFSDNDGACEYVYNRNYHLEKKYNKKVYVDILSEKVFFKAEEYHQDYSIKNPQKMEEELINSGRKTKN